MLLSWKACCGGVSQKWIFAIMAFLALWLNNALRVLLSMSITEMTLPLEEAEISMDHTCSRSTQPPSKNITITATENRYDWDEYTQGLILSSFFWGYAATQFPMGALSERFGGKYLLGLGILIPSVLTFFTPLCLQWGSYISFIILRVVMGMAGGTIYPAASTMIAHWSTTKDRTLVASIVYAGGILGNGIGTTLPAIIIKYSQIGWPSVFYYFGIIGMLWFPLWILLCYSYPSQHPFITESELNYLNEGKDTNKSKKSTPWRHILLSKHYWCFAFGLLGVDWVYYTLSSDLPKYMRNVVKFSLESNGLLSGLPYLSMWLSSIFFSWIANQILKREWLSKTNIRKSFGVLSLLGPATFILSASYAECNQFLVVFLLVTGMALMGSVFPSIYLIPLDLSPNYAGTMMAISNSIAAAGGIFSPWLVGVLTPNQTIGEWRQVFYISFGIAVACSIYIIIFTTSKTQPWNELSINKKNNLKNSSAPSITQESNFKTISDEING